MLLCPKCKKEGKCEHHGDVSKSTRYIDRYTFTCVECGHYEEAFEDGGEAGWNDGPTQCPFCGK